MKAYAQDFEALSKDGHLYVIVQNTGYVTADFSVSQWCCSRVSERRRVSRVEIEEKTSEGKCRLGGEKGSVRKGRERRMQNVIRVVGKGSLMLGREGSSRVGSQSLPFSRSKWGQQPSR